MIAALGMRNLRKLGDYLTWRHLTDASPHAAALIPRRSEAEWVQVLETLYFQY